MPQTPQEKAIMIELKKNDKALDSKITEVGKATNELVDALGSQDKVRIQDAQKIVSRKTDELSKLTEEKLDLRQRIEIRKENRIVSLWNNSDPNERVQFLIRRGFDEKEISDNAQLKWESLSEKTQNRLSKSFEDAIVNQVRVLRK